MSRLFHLIALNMIVIVTVPCLAGEVVEFRDQKENQRTVNGEILVEAQNGGLMLQGDDGRIWMIQPEQIINRESTAKAMPPADPEIVSQRLIDELGPGFAIYKTQNYLIAYNCNENYVQRVGALFEQLHRGFFTFWSNQKWELTEPTYPLVAVVLKNHDSFLDYAQNDIGDMANSVIGYYHLSSNRMTTFNVPNWERNVATIIHEATHQLAYNTGMQKRFADNPMWVSEGLATFFESPDMRNPGRWRSIGRVNQINLARWRKYIRNRPEESLMTLLADDQRFRNPPSVADAYAEGWAMTYFLIRTRRDEYVEYLRELSTGKPLAERTRRERIEMFESIMGEPLVKIDKAFTDYMRRVR
ncbi:DUF1570 domain-containing protein [bacterium]|nr:DUF1570 domain-containing protein [bacterium]